MLVLNQIKKDYGNFTALKDINLHFSKGIYGLIGPNGAGKTTLIKLIVSLIFPTEGEITWNGININKLGSRYRDVIGYLPQFFGYYPNYTAEKFLKYLCALKGIPRSAVNDKVNKLLDIVGLNHVKKKKLKHFSGGMIQRVGIAQALINDPKILILDEPTAGLDPKERVRFRQMLASLGKDRIVIISTHIVSDVESIAKEVIFIKNKTTFKVGSVLEIIKELEGMVWSIHVKEQEMEELEKKYVIVNKNIIDQNYQLRVISETKPHELAQTESPNLEDIFIYHYGQDLLLI